MLERLAGVLGDQLGHLPLRVEHLLGLDLDVRGRAADAAGGLVHHDPRVRQRVALARGAGAEQELPHRGGQAHRDRRDVVLDELHRVVDRHARGDRAAGRVDVEVDVLVRVLGREQQHLGADRVGHLVVDHRAEEDDPLAQQPLVDRVVEARAGAARARAARAARGGDRQSLARLTSACRVDPDAGVPWPGDRVCSDPNPGVRQRLPRDAVVRSGRRQVAPSQRTRPSVPWPERAATTPSPASRWPRPCGVPRRRRRASRPPLASASARSEFSAVEVDRPRRRRPRPWPSPSRTPAPWRGAPP